MRQHIIKKAKYFILVACIALITSCLPEDNRSSSLNPSSARQAQAKQHAMSVFSAAANLQVGVLDGTIPVGAINSPLLGANMAAANCGGANGNTLIVWMTGDGGQFALKGMGNNAGGVIANALTEMAAGATIGINTPAGITLTRPNAAGATNMPIPAGCAAAIPVGAPLMLVEGLGAAGNAVLVAGGYESFETKTDACPAGQEGNIISRRPTQTDPATGTKIATGPWELFKDDCIIPLTGFAVSVQNNVADAQNYARFGTGSDITEVLSQLGGVDCRNVTADEDGELDSNYEETIIEEDIVLPDTDIFEYMPEPCPPGQIGSMFYRKPIQADYEDSGNNVRLDANQEVPNTQMEWLLFINTCRPQTSAPPPAQGDKVVDSCNVGNGSIIDPGIPVFSSQFMGDSAFTDTRDPMDCPAGDTSDFTITGGPIIGVPGLVDVGVGWEGIGGITFIRMYDSNLDNSGGVIDVRRFWQGDTINCSRNEVLNYRCENLFPAFNADPPYNVVDASGFNFTRTNEINGWANAQNFIPNPPFGDGVGWTQAGGLCQWDERYFFDNCAAGFTPVSQGAYSRGWMTNDAFVAPTSGPWGSEADSVCENTVVEYLPCPPLYAGHIERTNGFQSRAPYPATAGPQGNPTSVPVESQISQVDIDMCTLAAACGPADGGSFNSAAAIPAGNMCDVGTAGPVSSTPAGFQWTCTEVSPAPAGTTTDACVAGFANGCSAGTFYWNGQPRTLAQVIALGVVDFVAPAVDISCLNVAPGCGTADGVVTANVPAAGNLCAANSTAGAVNLNTATNTYEWSCTGLSGTPTSCSAPAITGGQCGTANNVLSVSQPSTNLCSDGSTPAVSYNTSSSRWTWTCPGVNGGPTTNCSAPRFSFGGGCEVNGRPLGRGGYHYFGGPSCVEYRCECDGTLTSITPSPCRTVDEIGIFDTCSAATCGSANGTNVTAQPDASSLCAGGSTAGPVSTTASAYNWTCTGNTPVDTVNCSANLTGSCGTAREQCLSGSVDPASVIVAEDRVDWQCVSGTQSASCSITNPKPACTQTNQIPVCNNMVNGYCAGTWSCQAVVNCGTSLNTCASGNLENIADTATEELWNCRYNVDNNIFDTCSLPITPADPCTIDRGPYFNGTDSCPGIRTDCAAQLFDYTLADGTSGTCRRNECPAECNVTPVSLECPTVSTTSVDANARAGLNLAAGAPDTERFYVCTGQSIAASSCSATDDRCGTARCQNDETWDSTRACSAPVNGVCNATGGCTSGTYEFVAQNGLTTTYNCLGTNGGTPQNNCTYTITVTPCPAGQYMTGCGAGVDGCRCVPCTGNTIVNAAQNGCVACPAGQSPNADHTACVPDSVTCIAPSMEYISTCNNTAEHDICTRTSCNGTSLEHRDDCNNIVRTETNHPSCTPTYQNCETADGYTVNHGDNAVLYENGSGDCSFRKGVGCDDGSWTGTYANQVNYMYCNPYTYSWNTGTFGACSETCGGGTQTRTVTCQRSDGTTVADSYCSGTRPTTSQSCNTQACSGPTVTCTNNIQWDFDGACIINPDGSENPMCSNFNFQQEFCSGFSDCTISNVVRLQNTCARCDVTFTRCSSGFTGGGGGGGGGGGACFTAEAQITMADGSKKKIEDIVVGDMVMSFDKSRADGALVAARVTHFFNKNEKEVFEVAGTKVTKGHKFMTASGEMKAIEDIAADEEIMLEDGTTIKRGEMISLGVRPVFNMTVEGHHSYIADGLRAGNMTVSPPIPEGHYDASDLLNKVQVVKQ